MKTWEEKFDDEIRKKVSGSEVQPPPRLFDQIIPEEKKKRGFLWIWITGVIILVSTALTVHFNTGKNHLLQLSGKNQDKTSSTQPLNKNNVNTNETVTNQTSETVTDLDNSDQHISIQNSSSANSANHNSAGLEKSQNDYSTSIALNVPKKKKSKKNSGNGVYYYPTRKSEGNNLTGAYGKLPVSGYGNLDMVLTMQTLGHSPSGMKPIQGVQLMKPSGTSFDDHLPSRWMVEFYAGANFRNIEMESNTNDTSLIRLINSRNTKGTSSTGWHLGANVLYRLNDKFVISFGTQFNQWQEEFNFDFTEYYTLLDIDTISYFILFPFTPPVMVSDVDSTFNYFQTSHAINHKINFSTISLQSEFRYNIPVNKFVISPGIGLKLNMINFYKGSSNFNNKFEETDNTNYYNKSTQLAFTGGIHLGFTLSEKTLFFANPSYTFSPGSITKDDYLYNQKNNSFNLGFGVQYNFSKKQAAD
ncbi:MAG: hypothetical protein IPI23_07130 [Bacteroidetes bacterium]|nr:hypothetical protein [Bacteroidota bacterium]